MFSFVDHTAELELRIEAPTREGILAEAVAAFHAILARDGGGGATERLVEATGTDDPTLLAAWIDELVFLVETEGFVGDRADDVAISGHAARGRVTGRLGTPPHLVKGATYSDLELRPADGGWVGRVVLDV